VAADAGHRCLGHQANLGELAKLGWTPVAMLVVETAVIALFTVAVIAVWRI
jgi:hypothetical protein